jgi:hypothetical protein
MAWKISRSTREPNGGDDIGNVTVRQSPERGVVTLRVWRFVDEGRRTKHEHAGQRKAAGEQQQTGDQKEQHSDTDIELSEDGRQQVDDMIEAYQDKPTAVLPGTHSTITGTAINEWLDDEGNPKFGDPDEHPFAFLMTSTSGELQIPMASPLLRIRLSPICVTGRSHQRRTARTSGGASSPTAKRLAAVMTTLTVRRAAR